MVIKRRDPRAASSNLLAAPSVQFRSLKNLPRRPSLVMKPPADVTYLEEAYLLLWRPRGILDKAAVNKVLRDLRRREAIAAKPFNRFSDLSLVESFSLARIRCC